MPVSGAQPFLNDRPDILVCVEARSVMPAAPTRQRTVDVVRRIVRRVPGGLGVVELQSSRIAITGRQRDVEVQATIGGHKRPVVSYRRERPFPSVFMSAVFAHGTLRRFW